MTEREKEKRECYIPPCSVCPNFELDDKICFNGKSADDCPAYKLEDKLHGSSFYRRFKEWFIGTQGGISPTLDNPKYRIAKGIYSKIKELEDGT